MLLMALFLMILSLLSLILLSLCLAVSKKSELKREKMTPFECGFDFMSLSRLPFSLKFFLIVILFIIFDIEIALVIPLVPSVMKSSIFLWMTTLSLFLIILILGVFLEWKEKSLDWKF